MEVSYLVAFAEVETGDVLCREEATFGEFLHLLPRDGVAIGKGTDPRIMRQLEKLTCRTVTFGTDESCDWHSANLTEDDLGRARFTLVHGLQEVTEVRMGVPGLFNVENALAALAAAGEAGCDMAQAVAAIEQFIGAHRRFEKTDELNGAEIFHDYGHNPTEMRNALSIARRRCKGRLIAVMQPHTFSRVRTLFNDYLTCTAAADLTLVTDICAAREKDPGDLNSGMLVEGMRAHGIDARWTPSFDDTEKALMELLQPGDLALTMGCGDINLLNDQIHRHLAAQGKAEG